jgi:TonB family protein
VRSATSEPAVLQRIIGQPVVVMPSAAKRMQAEDALYDDETSTEEAPAEESGGRPSTQQRYLILVGLVAAVIVPLCWAGLGGLRPHRDRTAVEAPQAPPQQSAAVATPIVRSQPDPAAPESEVTSTNVMHPGDAATPAGGAADVDNGAVPGSPTTAIDRAGTSATTPVANRAGMSGSATPVDRAATPVGTAAADRAAMSGGATTLGAARVPGSAGPSAAAAGTSTSASRSADYSHGGGTSDNTNMTAGSGGSAEPSIQHQEFPEIPSRIRQTIHGHVKVSVRVIVDEGGSVFAALVDSPGPSRYFERAAIEAAKKWTFPPADSTSRLKLVQFDFTRDGTTGQVIELQ